MRDFVRNSCCTSVEKMFAGIALKPWDVLRPWQRAPNLNTCYSDMVKHKLTPTHKSWRPGVGLQGLVEACPVAVRQMQAVTQNVGAHLKPLTRSYRPDRTQNSVAGLCPPFPLNNTVHEWLDPRPLCLHIQRHRQGVSPSNTQAKVVRRSQDGSASLWLTCGFIFKLKKKIIVIYDLEYFAIPFQIKDRTLKFVTSYEECFQAAWFIHIRPIFWFPCILIWEPVQTKRNNQKQKQSIKTFSWHTNVLLLLFPCGRVSVVMAGHQALH